MKRRKGYLMVMTGVFFIAAVSHLIFPSYMIENSIWGFDFGWQRELGAMYLAITFVNCYALYTHNDDQQHILVMLAMTMCIGVGFNNLGAWLSSPLDHNSVHIVGVINFLIIGGFGGVYQGYRIMAKAVEQRQ
ncbi:MULTISPECIES: hypothetical protein [unclassified Erysipelothrix]|uniref:hypothetical protein n=1 Tax=unclassified Erysipelothrix TaxID=2624170 RepID=UPI0013790AC1|nr:MULTISPECIES: hypothetical protein [unclassified Erysipelothrix]MBK2402740.1 hypothetical protein [Erysipelothrix sp. strain 2 (EsS2-6-Brazil)]MBK2404169.1 hypothetical protein [Erysipelothrix sp. strain 2 (EsS2-7-Brazil)]NBA01890.1 hypothetical protein [Erysipelothrix rhusiopathiae]